MAEEWIMYEHPGVYDGWILKFTYSGKIEWRDHWRVHQLTDTRKLEIEGTLRIAIEKQKAKA